MSEVKFGFIGTGNMGSAIARAVRKSLPGHEILLSDKNEGKAQSLATEFGRHKNRGARSAICGFRRKAAGFARGACRA